MNSLPLPRLLPACFLLGLFLCATTAQAHNLFLILYGKKDGPDQIDIIFEHAPYPGKGGYYQPFLERGKTWVRQLDGTDTELQISRTERLGKPLLETKTETAGPRALIHTCEWGIYKGRMDYFHGKFLDVGSAEELAQLAATPELPLDLIPTWNEGVLEVAVQFEGEPLRNRKIWIWSAGSKPTTATTDADGILRRQNLAPGLHFFATVHMIDGPTGEFDGEPYEGLMHGTTVGFRLPKK